MKVAGNCQILFLIMCLLASNVASSRTFSSAPGALQLNIRSHNHPTRMERRLRNLSMLSSLKNKALQAVGLGPSLLEKTKTRYLLQLKSKQADIRDLQADNTNELEEALRRVEYFDAEFSKAEVQFASQLLQMQLDALKVVDKIRA